MGFHRGHAGGFLAVVVGAAVGEVAQLDARLVCRVRFCVAAAGKPMLASPGQARARDRADLRGGSGAVEPDPARNKAVAPWGNRYRACGSVAGQARLIARAPVTTIRRDPHRRRPVLGNAGGVERPVHGEQRVADAAGPCPSVSARGPAAGVRGGRSAGTPRAGEADSPESRCCRADRHNRQDPPDQRDQAAVNRTIHPVIEERRAAMASSGGLTVALRHRDFRYLIGAYSVAAIGGWAYNVGLAVWIYDETGSAAWVGAATVCRFVPALLFGPYGGVLADRSERVRLMVRLDVVAAVLMGLLVVVTALDFPVPLAILITAVASTVGTMYAPAAAALTPQLVGERDLGAANTLRNTIDNLCVIAGPAVGALLLLLGPRRWRLASTV